MADPVRVFIATTLPDPILKRIGVVRDHVKRHGFNIKWVRSGNIHLTLKFLGAVGSDDIDAIGAAMTEAVQPLAPFFLLSRGVGVFPGIKRPRVFWTGIDGDVASLVELQKTLDGRLHAIGYRKDARPFVGHLTIGRVKGRLHTGKLENAIQKFEGFRTEAFSVDTIHLIRSDLKPTGAVYTPLKCVGLKTINNP